MKQVEQVVRLSEDDLDHVDFDKILEFEIGEFGTYQILSGITIGLVSAFGSYITLNFMFSAFIPEHRCFVPECEPIGSNDFNAEWLKYAIPHNDGQLDPCSRYAYIGTVDPGNGACSAENFNQSNVIRCDSFITKDNEERLVSHLNMLCTGQDRKLALFGTAGTIARFVGTFIFGIVADRYGRLITIVACATICAIFSCTQTLPAPYMTFEIYWTLEFLAALFSTGMLGSGIVYSMEWVTSKHRVRLNNIVLVVLCIGDYTGVSFAAWYFADNFIAFKLALSIPAFFSVFLYCFLSESPRWLLTRNKYAEAIKSISKAGKVNGKPLRKHTIQQIENASMLECKEKSIDDKSNKVTIMELLREKTLAFRLFIISLIWLFTLFSFFGILFGSTNVHSNKYISFLVIGLADLPGNALNLLLMNRWGRKATISSTLFIYGILLLASTQVPTHGFYRLILFVVSKTAITCALVGLFLFGSEFWPTSIRSTAFSIGKMTGRVGAILASMSVLLVEYHVNLPAILYASAAIFGSILLVVCLPETMHCEKLPDTIEEALAIGKGVKKRRLSNKRSSIIELT